MVKKKKEKPDKGKNTDKQPKPVESNDQEDRFDFGGLPKINLKKNLGCGWLKKMMKKNLFKILAKINKVIMPRFSQRDITRLSKIEKAMVAYRYWVTLNALD